MTPPGSNLKLKLDSQDGVHQLHILSEMVPDDFKIIQAGITKLIRDGKNRIFLIFYANEKLDPDSTEGLKKLNLIARELAGEIVLISASNSFCENVKVQAKDEKILCYSTVAEAQKFLRSREPKSAENELIQKLKAQLREKEAGGETTKLKTDLETLKKENQILISRIDKMLDERREGYDAQSLLERIQILEKKLTAALIANEGAAPTKSGAAAPSTPNK